MGVMNVKTLCLGILAFEDMTGYDIRKLAAEGRFSHFCEAGYGSIYPALAQLTEAGLVTFREEVLEGKPNRKIYSLTEAGFEQLMRSLESPPGADRFKSEFLFYSLFADRLSSAFFTGHITAKIAETEEALERLMSSYEKCEHEPSRFALGFGVEINRAALAYLKKYQKAVFATEQGGEAGVKIVAGKACCAGDD